MLDLRDGNHEIYPYQKFKQDIVHQMDDIYELNGFWKKMLPKNSNV
jgi:hypothetical protein